MTASHFTELHCDFPGCWNRWPEPTPKGRSRPFYREPSITRDAAAKSGWECRDGGDWCPDHAGST